VRSILELNLSYWQQTQVLNHMHPFSQIAEHLTSEWRLDRMHDDPDISQWVRHITIFAEPGCVGKPDNNEFCVSFYKVYSTRIRGSTAAKGMATQNGWQPAGRHPLDQLPASRNPLKNSQVYHPNKDVQAEVATGIHMKSNPPGHSTLQIV
jgi:hypothetical protein